MKTSMQFFFFSFLKNQPIYLGSQGFHLSNIYMDEYCFKPKVKTAAPPVNHADKHLFLLFYWEELLLQSSRGYLGKLLGEAISEKLMPTINQPL